MDTDAGIPALIVFARYVVPMSAERAPVGQHSPEFNGSRGCPEEANGSGPSGASQPGRHQREWLDDHAVAVSTEGKILGILSREAACSRWPESRFPGITRHDLGKRHVLIPGLINAHSHAAMSLLRGFADDGSPLTAWLAHYMWPAEGEFAGEDFVKAGSQIAISEMLRTGTTCVNDMYFFPEVFAEVACSAGMRAVVSAPIIDFPSAYAQSPQEYLEKAVALASKHSASGDMLNVALGPHSPYTVGDASFSAIARESARLGLRVHTHLHETAKEVEDHLAAHGVRPFERLDKLGLVDGKLFCAHMTQMTDDEVQTAARVGLSVCHCPESNMKLQSGVCGVAKLLRAGVNVCMGTDGAASNDDLDMFGELRTAALLDKLHATAGRATVSSYEWLKIATINGARALGLDHVTGSLEAGKMADMVAVEMLCEPVYNPVTNLVHVGTNRVDHVWVNGRHVVSDAKVRSIRAKDLTAQAREWGQRIGAWDHERKTHNAAAVRAAIDNAIDIPSDVPADDERIAAAIRNLEQQKQLLFHQQFFASCNHMHCKSSVGIVAQHSDELEQRLADLQARAKKD